MVRILGNSPERVELKDLNDIVYYRQLKEYTDQQYESSKDLKREIQKGSVIKIDKKEVSQWGSAEIRSHQLIESSKSLNVAELKTALREMLPEFKGEGVSESALKGAIREIAPMIVEMVRQEVSKISVNRVEEAKSKTIDKGFTEPIYVSDISDISDLKSNVKIEQQERSGETMVNALKALKRFKNK